MRSFVVKERLTTGTDAFKNYLNEIGKIKLLSESEYSLILNDLKSDNEKIVNKAKEKLIKNSLRFVVSVAKQYIMGDHDINDLVSEGNIGLIKAAERYDPETGIRFLSYAVWWVRKYILIYVNTAKSIRLPLHTYEAINKIKKFKTEFITKNSREPELEDYFIAGFKKNDYEFLIDSANLETVSLDIEMDTDDSGGLTRKDTIVSNDFDYTDDYEENESNVYKVSKLLTTLPKRDMNIIMDLFGINTRVLTMDEASVKHNISRERVRQIKEESLKVLKKHHAFMCM